VNAAILEGVLIGQIDRESIALSVKRIEYVRKEIADGFGFKANPRN